MTRPTLRFPDQVCELLARKYRNQRQEWIGGCWSWPLVVSLGEPKEADAQAHPDALRDWLAAWSGWPGPGEVAWEERRWRSVGVQRLPRTVAFACADDVAVLIGEERKWSRARGGFERLTRRWPGLADRLPRYFAMLADLSERDLQTLERLLGWLEANPQPDIYPRQIPLAGMDTKWLEPRMPVVTDLLTCLRGDDSERRGGLKAVPHLLRMRILDPALRACAGGLSDLAAPAGDLAGLRLPVSRVYVVENLQTGLAFEELSGAVVFMGLGRGACSLAQVPWVAQADCVYWGDIDTQGIAILSSLRAVLPGIRSVMMGEETLLRYQDLWVEEPVQYAASSLPFLSDEELRVYEGLKQQRWGCNVRLEQERIAWDYAWSVVCE
jgi:hypothetical protein